MALFKRKPKRRSKKSNWKNHISTWERSGMTQAAYCLKNNISLSSFTNWRVRLKTEEPENMPLVELSLSGSAALSSHKIKLELSNNFCLKIREEIDPMLLRDIIAALGGIS